MGQKKKAVDFCVTIALLIIMAGTAVFGISIVLEAFTSYDFDVTGDSLAMLLRMYNILKYTRMAVLAILFVSVAAKSLQFVKTKES